MAEGSKRRYTLKELAMEEISDEVGVEESDVYAISYFRSPRLLGRPSVGFIALLKSLEGLKKIDVKPLLEAAKNGTLTIKWLVLVPFKRLGRLERRIRLAYGSPA